MRDLKPQTRGVIESSFDDFLKVDFSSNIQLLEDEVPIQSLRDLCLGYVTGGLYVLAHTTIFVVEKRVPTNEDGNEINSILKRRLSEILRKINEDLNR